MKYKINAVLASLVDEPEHKDLLLSFIPQIGMQFDFNSLDDDESLDMTVTAVYYDVLKDEFTIIFEYV